MPRGGVPFGEIRGQTAFHRRSHDSDLRPPNVDIDDWLAGVSALGKHAQRCSREQPPMMNEVLDAPGLVFTRLRLLFDGPQGLSVVERLD